MDLPVTAQDRVLILSLKDPALPRRFRAAFAVVGMGSPEEVRAARRACADLANFMFVPGGPEEIPWQERWFTLILSSGDPVPTPAMLRVLAEGGRVVSLS